MKRTAIKVVGMVFGAVGVLILAGSCLSLMKAGGGDATFGLLFGGIWTAVGVGSYLRIRKFEQRDFAWFKRTYPQYCGPNGKVVCTSCESRHIRIRGLMQRTYTREHFCGTCGHTLYYSPEG